MLPNVSYSSGVTMSNPGYGDDYAASSASGQYANPKFNAAAAEQQQYYNAGEQQLYSQPMPTAFAGRDSVAVDSLSSVNVTSLLERDQHEVGMDAPTIGAPSTGFRPSDTARRKGHITYLAHHALANAKSLENQWKQGALKKREARARYGF